MSATEQEIDSLLLAAEDLNTKHKEAQQAFKCLVLLVESVELRRAFLHWADENITRPECAPKAQAVRNLLIQTSH